MKYKRFSKISLVLVLVIIMVLLPSCGDASSTAQGEIPIDTSDFKLPEISGDRVIGNNIVDIDISNVSDGYMCIKYHGNSDKNKLQLKHDDDTYTYDLNDTSKYITFPLSCGDGTYQIEVYENIQGDQYALVAAESIDVTLKDETTPFLYPNNYVDYTSDSAVVPLTLDVTSSSENQLKLVEDVYTYVVNNIAYDYDKAESVSTGYVPDLDLIISQGKGICFDYASLMSAMLRIRNIPTKLVIGYSGDVYHAWISVYISDIGWVDNAIEFDGTDWTLMDPTFAASSHNGNEADYVNNEDKYHALYFY